MAPRLVVNLNAIAENTRKTIDLCRGFGVEVVGNIDTIVSALTGK